MHSTNGLNEQQIITIYRFKLLYQKISISLCLCQPSSTLKATAIQTLRYYCKDPKVISEMIRNNVTFFVAV